MNTTANVKKVIGVEDVFYKVDKVDGSVEYHKLINSTVEMINGVPTVKDGEDVRITKEEYEASV